MKERQVEPDFDKKAVYKTEQYLIQFPVPVEKNTLVRGMRTSRKKTFFGYEATDKGICV